MAETHDYNLEESYETPLSEGDMNEMKKRLRHDKKFRLDKRPRFGQKSRLDKRYRVGQRIKLATLYRFY